MDNYHFKAIPSLNDKKLCQRWNTKLCQNKSGIIQNKSLKKKVWLKSLNCIRGIDSNAIQSTNQNPLSTAARNFQLQTLEKVKKRHAEIFYFLFVFSLVFLLYRASHQQQSAKLQSANSHPLTSEPLHRSPPNGSH